MTTLMTRESEEKDLSIEGLFGGFDFQEELVELTAIEQEFAAEDDDGTPMAKAIFANLVTP